MKTSHLVTAAAAAAFALAAQTQFVAPAAAQNAVPHYEADPAWPKPLPNRWILGGLGGLCVDAQDHVVILNRQDILDGELTAGSLAPSIIEFDPAGNVVNSWSNPQLLDAAPAQLPFRQGRQFLGRRRPVRRGAEIHP